MEDEFRLFVFIHQQVLVISMLWEAYALGSGKTTMWMCQYLYPPGSCMDSFDKVSCLVGELIFGHPIALGLVSIVIFCCQRYVRSTYRRCFPCIKPQRPADTAFGGLFLVKLPKTDDDEENQEDNPDADATTAAQKAFQTLVVCLNGASEYVIQEGSVGHTYEGILADHIDEHLTVITVEDGYLREPHQVEQLKELLRVFARLAPNLKRVNLVANRAKNSDLLAVQAWFEQSYGIILQFRFDKSIHDRWLRLNNGYNVSMGRGLDIYYPPSSVPWEQRKCRGCTFSFMPTKKLEILGACYAPLNTNTD